MNFRIDQSPPAPEQIQSEKARISVEIKRIAFRDNLVTFILIVFSSAILGMVVYWSTENITYAGIAAAVFPLVGIVCSLIGVTRAAGFRSAAIRLAELNNELISLNPVSAESAKDIQTLRSRYKNVDAYQLQVEESDRPAVNGELAMYWEFDASTGAKSARGREFLHRARSSVGA